MPGRIRRGVRLSFIRPGKPVENAYIESFNGRFRDECLNDLCRFSTGRARGADKPLSLQVLSSNPDICLQSIG